MVNENKILTVSYGTFSCTLEGFDDPFTAMKSIAEYFRDLAADDRYFGAEPPQPDPQMMQRLAEKSSNAQVQARVSDNSVVLSPNAAAPAAQTSDADTAITTASAAMHFAQNPAPAPQPVVAPVPTLAPEGQTAPATSMESVAAKLRRIRAVAARETSTDALFSEDQHADAFLPSDTAEHVADSATPAATPPVAAPADVAQDIPAQTPPTPSEPIAPEPVEHTAAPDMDSAPVEDAAPDTTEDVAPAQDTPVVAEDASTEEAAEPETIDAAADPEPVEAKTEDTVETPETPATDTQKDEAATDAATSAPRRRIVVQKITREDMLKARADALKRKEDVANRPPPPPPLPPENEDALAAALQAMQKEDTLAELAQDHAATRDAAAQSDVIDPDIHEETEAEAPDQRLTEDAIAKMLSATDEHTALEAALGDFEEEEDHFSDAEEQVQDASTNDALRDMRRARAAALEASDDEDLERLMDATSSRLDHDESSQRRASIAHLKAAVAATKADSSLTEAGALQEASDRDQYAEDLAQMVRPERAKTHIDGYKSDRPAPLVLVSEQRIDKFRDAFGDRSSDTAAEDVRPRRVDMADIADELSKYAEPDDPFTAPIKKDFAEYAAASDALELPDLLEAAAAHYTFYEQTDGFTRPMLMRKIAPISEEQGLTREQGLRSFGTLLRDGKFIKVENGRFMINKNTRFAPQARIAGE